MIHAYDKAYLGIARTSLGRAFDYAAHCENMDLSQFCRLFLSTGIASKFERGNARTIAGQSGVELARSVLASTIGDGAVMARYTASRSPEYWAGWALAHYQWSKALPFATVLEGVPITSIVSMYPAYHEMDLEHFVARMDELMGANTPASRLKKYRTSAGLSQSQLAALSGVPVRSIQQYEQGQKRLNRASFETVLRLAQAVGAPDPRALLDV